MEKLTKRKVYLPVRVGDEFPNGECVMISKTHDMLVGYPADVNGEIQADDEHQILRHITHWLKEQEAFVFTPQQLNEYTAKVIRQALETAAEEAHSKLVPFSNDTEVDKKSILDTFDETYNIFKQ